MNRTSRFPSILSCSRHVVVVALFCSCVLPACSTGAADAGEGECTTMSACGDVEDVCDRCPDLGESLCLEGTCETRGDDAVDVTATVSIEPRQLVVASLVHALASTTSGTGSLSCDDAVSASGIAAEVNVFATGTKALSGGSFHPDVSVGRTPSGDIALLLLGTDGAGGSGDVIATGCMTGLEAAGSTLVIDLITLDGL